MEHLYEKLSTIILAALDAKERNL